MSMFVSMAQPINTERSESPYFEIISDDITPVSFPLKSTRADVQISGVIAGVTVTQLYENRGNKPIEAIYVFPGSSRAAVNAMMMTIGDRIIQAKILEKGKARQDYEQVKQQGRSASLLEQKRPNVFQMNVANIMPGDIIEVQLSYTELLVPEEGRYEFVYPTVVGPRFANGSEGPATPAGDGWVQNPYTKQGVLPTYDFDISVNISAGMPLSDVRCKSHNVALNWLGEDHLSIDLKENEKKSGNRDYILEYRLRGNKIHSGLLLFEGKEENFFLAMIQPPKVVRPEVIPPREYVFIVDVSGSMTGFPLEVSKKLLTNLIGGLKPTDRFNVVFFASSNSVLSEASLPATTENINKAMTMMNGYSGGGGTQLLPALQTALAMKGTEDYARSFIIATDGYVSVEREAFDLIRNNLGNANFFAFGIGSSVNRFLMEGLAHIGKGEPFIVTNPMDAEAKAEKFREYVRYPVLTNIKARFEGFDAYDVEPASIPDVLSERPVMIIGKWRGEPKGQIVVEGMSGEGTYTQSFNLESTRKKGNNSALKYLWARERIRLLDDYALAGFENDEHRNEVLNIGLKYNLLTRYTSFLAIDSELRNTSGENQTIIQPLPLPQGVSNNATANYTSIGVTNMKSPAGGLAPVMQIINTREDVSIRKTESLDIIKTDEELDVEDKDESLTKEIFSVVEKMPEFIGGQDRLLAFIKNNFHYPEALKVSGISGTIIVGFIIEADGRISDVKVLRGLHPQLDAAAIDVIKRTAGQWLPGKQRGKPVKVSFNVPVKVQP